MAENDLTNYEPPGTTMRAVADALGVLACVDIEREGVPNGHTNGMQPILDALADRLRRGAKIAEGET